MLFKKEITEPRSAIRRWTISYQPEEVNHVMNMEDDFLGLEDNMVPQPIDVQMEEMLNFGKIIYILWRVKVGIKF